MKMSAEKTMDRITIGTIVSSIIDKRIYYFRPRGDGENLYRWPELNSLKAMVNRRD
jgi:hypothetical protein